MKILPPNNMSLSEVSNETGIPLGTLSTWKSKELNKSSKKINISKDKFLVVVETYTLSEYELNEYCRKNGLYVQEVKRWQKCFASALDKEPEPVKEAKEELTKEKKKVKSLEKEINRKDKALAEAAALLVLRKKLQAFRERGRLTTLSERQTIIKLINEARENGARLKQACKIAGITDRTYERWVEGNNIKEDQRPYADRPEPVNKLTQDEYKSILRIVNSPGFVDLPPSQIVPTLADKGIYIASESTMYRILRNENMQHNRGRSKAPTMRKTPETHIAKAPNEVWSWDITYLNTSVRGLYYKLYMIVDIYSRKIVGWEVWHDENGELASQLVERTVTSEKVRNKPLILHSDNGPPMKSFTLKSKLESLGIIKSYSRPRVSNDNPYSESLFRTCKYRPNYPRKGFETIDEAREWVNNFVDWYNNEHYHSSLKFTTPNSVHTGQVNEILKKRKKVYETAKKLHPERWKKPIRDWDPIREVALNPIKNKQDTLKTGFGS
ncbi:IS3 family transposase [Herbivorax sp. ANBcel31]|uniref:IS3 family transposase n=1 Tax=Herbivorax sp. ANBcel31 TaxID=3069754 RepID=UPI0035941197